MASDGFEPEDLDALLNDFSARLRERDKPIDLTISLARLTALQRPAPAGVPRRPGAGRWNMDDVSDVEDLSERRRALEARAEQQAAERAAAIANRQRAAAAESVAPPRIALVRVPESAALDLSSLGRMLERVAHQAAAHAAHSRAGAGTDTGFSSAPTLKT